MSQFEFPLLLARESLPQGFKSQYPEILLHSLWPILDIKNDQSYKLICRAELWRTKYAGVAHCC